MVKHMIRIRRPTINNGQSAIEYTLLLAVAIAVLVVVLVDTHNSNSLRNKIGDAYNQAGVAMGNTARDITNGVFNP